MNTGCKSMEELGLSFAEIVFVHIKQGRGLFTHTHANTHTHLMCASIVDCHIEECLMVHHHSPGCRLGLGPGTTLANVVDDPQWETDKGSMTLSTSQDFSWLLVTPTVLSFWRSCLEYIAGASFYVGFVLK